MTDALPVEDTTPCECGHIWDEHEPGGLNCTVEDCRCDYFEAAEGK